MSNVRHEDHAAYITNTSREQGDDVINRALAIIASRLKDRPCYDQQKLTSPTLVSDYLVLQLAEREHEVFCALFLNTQHQLIRFEELFRGTLDSASVYPREVAKRALELNAAAVIYAHNHPSGAPTPSNADHRITAKLKEALGLFEIRTLDHIIVAGTRTYSFSEHGNI